MSIDVYPGSFSESDLLVTMANVNAKTVFAALGLELESEDGCGEFDAADVLERSLLALGTGVSGRPTHRGGNFVDCGMDVEWVEQKIGQIAAIARFCAEYGVAKISWG